MPAGPPADRIRMTSPLRHLTLAAAAAAALAPAALAAPSSPSATCHGLPVTVDAHNGEVFGTPRADVIRLTAAGTVHSGAGDDIVCGSPQGDRILSGPGDDIVLGGGGADVIRSGSGRDHVYGEAGADHLHGGRHRDVLVPGGGWDVVSAGDLDSVEQGRYAISMYLPPQAVQALLMTGQRVTMTRPAAPGQGGLVPVWTSFTPMISNSVTWGGGLWAYASQSLLQEGAMLFSAASTPVGLGTGWNVQNYTFTPGPPSPSSNAVTLMNQGQSPVVLGLQQSVSVNGMTSVGPVSATTVFPFQMVPLQEPSSVTIFPSTFMQAGMLTGNTPPGALTVTPTPASPTVPVTFDLETGTFISQP